MGRVGVVGVPTDWIKLNSDFDSLQAKLKGGLT